MLVFLQSASALVSVVFVLGAWENGQTDLGKSEHEHRNLRHPQQVPGLSKELPYPQKEVDKEFEGVADHPENYHY